MVVSVGPVGDHKQNSFIKGYFTGNKPFEFSLSAKWFHPIYVDSERKLIVVDTDTHNLCPFCVICGLSQNSAKTRKTKFS